MEIENLDEVVIMIWGLGIGLLALLGMASTFWLIDHFS